MSRRTAAGLLAMVLVAGFVIYAGVRSTGYVTFRPGPTINVLGKYDDRQVIEVTGRKTYPDDGGLRMVTIIPSPAEENVNLVEVLAGWFDRDVAVLPKEAVYPKGTTDKQQQQQSAVEMSTSQDAATAAALKVLGIPFRARAVAVAEVGEGTPADGKLEVGDVIVSVDGTPITDADALLKAIRRHRPGEDVAVVVTRDERELTVTLKTVAYPESPTIPRIGITPGYDFEFPFRVRFNISDTIGGPSAGMMFALSLYDVLTPGSLTGGQQVAGSGEIDADGVVGSIGGIGQKIVGAQRDGAKLFLVAADNCAEAATAHYDRSKIQLVKVRTLRDAITDLEAWSRDPSTDLPGCTP